VRLPDGKLYDLLDMSTLTLVVMADTEAATPDFRGWEHAITVRHIGVAPELAPGPAWLLVRPDGYLAAAGGLDGGARLSRWLDRWLVASQFPKSSRAALASGSALPNSSSMSAHSAVAATHSRAD
jgi:hypothetical protein